MTYRTTLSLLVLTSLTTPPALAGETDDFYAWRRPVRDSTEAFNAEVRRVVDDALRDVNRGRSWRRRTCPEVAHEIFYPWFWTEYRTLLRVTRDYGLDYAPRSNTELSEGPPGIYRGAPLRFWGLWTYPLDPTVQLGGVTFGTDKIAHFFPNGWRLYRRYHETLARGGSEEDAFRAAIALGVEQEQGVFGRGPSSIFSFADLESNYQGLVFFQRLCDGEDPWLQKTDEGFVLSYAFDIADWVSPCWDESFYGNYYYDGLWSHVELAYRERCRVLARPEVQRRRAAYERRGCHSRSFRYLEELRRRGEVPNWHEQSIEVVCGIGQPVSDDPPARGRRHTHAGNDTSSSSSPR